MHSKILTVSTVRPPYQYTTDQVITEVKKWLADQPELLQKKAIRIFEGAQIETRSSILPIEQVFSDLSFEEKNNLYIEKAIEIGEEVLSMAIDQAGLAPTDIDYVISTSCTGFMIPSVDAFLINRLGMKQHIGL